MERSCDTPESLTVSMQTASAAIAVSCVAGSNAAQPSASACTSKSRTWASRTGRHPAIGHHSGDQQPSDSAGSQHPFQPSHVEGRVGDLFDCEIGGLELVDQPMPPDPGAKSPLRRNGRIAFRCGEMNGSPPLPGTRVKWVETIHPPVARSAATTGASRGPRRRSPSAPPRPAVGAVRVHEIVLQVGDQQGGRGPVAIRWCERVAQAGVMMRFPNGSTRASSPGSTTMVVSGCSSSAGPAMIAPTARSAVRRSQHRASRRNQTGGVPRSRASGDLPSTGASTDMSNFGRRPITAVRWLMMRVGIRRAVG